MVDITQLVECYIVAVIAKGSSPFIHPSKNLFVFDTFWNIY